MSLLIGDHFQSFYYSLQGTVYSTVDRAVVVELGFATTNVYKTSPIFAVRPQFQEINCKEKRRTKPT